MRLLLIFVTFIAWAYASDGGFGAFCKGEYLEGELSADGKTCTKTYFLDGVDGKDLAEGICHHRGRFAVKEAKVEKDTLTCKWEFTGKCESDHYIHRYCYQLAPTCPKDWTQANVNDRSAFRWVVATFNAKLVKFKLPTSAKKPTKMYSKSVLLPAGNGTSLETAVLLQRMPVFRGRPGDLVFFEKNPQEPVYTVCRKLAFGEPSTALGGGDGIGGTTSNPTNNGPGAFGNRGIPGTSKEIGDYTIWLTRNVYPNKMLPSGEVDMNHFHRICEKYCDGCYAGTPDLMTNVAKELPNDIFWLPGSRGFISAETSSCSATPDDDHDNWKILHHPIHNKAITLKATLWKDGYPNRQCSDQGRYALAYLGGKVLSVPIFDRLPLACIQGAQLPLPADVSNCYKNSENAGNGACKCKPGFIDINNAELLKKQKEDVINHIINLKQKPGRVCVREKCQENTREIEVPYDAILFLMDSSQSLAGENFDKMRQFNYDAISWLPRKVAIFMVQYGSTAVPPYPFYSRWGMVSKSWTDEAYRALVAKVMTEQIHGVSPTYAAIEKLADWWIDKGEKVHRKALMVCITDGDDPGFDGGRPRREQIIQKLRDNGIHLKYVEVRGILHAEARGEVENEKEDIVKLDSYDDLKEKLKTVIEKIMQCDKITLQHIAEAMTRAYN